MGLEIDRDSFEQADYRRFELALERELAVLRELLGRDGFGTGPDSLGLELELNLIDPHGRPLAKNRQVAERAADTRLTLEVDRFNLEINGTPQPLSGAPFRALYADLAEALLHTRAAAAEVGGAIAAIGILPTLEPGDLTSEVLTNQKRYRALSAGLRRLRQDVFPVVIEGPERLEITADDVTFEGAATSLQVHIKVPPDSFARFYNAALLATGPLLSACCNSPLLFGRQLWQETRVALFRQAVDDREGAVTDDWRPARVSFGHGWVRGSAYELFAESVMQHEPLLPVPSSEDAAAVLAAGGTPRLESLRLHHGTVWRWNRAIYDPAQGGHLRMELRALPAGPTLTDMIANTALAVGLVYGLEPELDTLLSSLSFGHARRNFYQAAQHGLDAELVWSAGQRGGPSLVEARRLLPRLLSLAHAGLGRAGVEPEEAARWLGVLEERLVRGTSGAQWQASAFERLRGRQGRRAAAIELLQRYQELALSDAPVHTWPDP